MSTTKRFGLASIKGFGVERNSKALLSSFGSTHRNISCGLTGAPVTREVGTKCDMNRGLVGLLRSKNFRSKGEVVSLVRGQAWRVELQRKFTVISSFFFGQTRTSRDVIPTGCPAGFKGAGISPTTVGLAGLLMSTMRMTGCGCGQVSKPFARRGSPTPQRLEPSVRLP